MNFNCAPRPRQKTILDWFRSPESLRRKYCTHFHGLVYVPGYTASNGHHECPECGLTDLDGLKVDYKKFPWYEFGE